MDLFGVEVDCNFGGDVHKVVSLEYTYITGLTSLFAR